MLYKEEMLILKASLTLLIFYNASPCDLGNNVSYTVIFKKNVFGSTLQQQPIVISKSGEKQALDISFNLSCTSFDNVSVTIICRSCFWMDLEINNSQFLSTLKQERNKDLVFFSNTKIINVSFSWIQISTEMLYDELRVLIKNHAEVLFNHSIIKLNVSFSCPEVLAVITPLDVILHQNTSFPIKLSWQFPFYDDALYSMEYTLLFPEFLMFKNFDCTAGNLLSVNMSVKQITYRFNLSSSLECNGLMVFNMLVTPGLNYFINISLKYSRNMQPFCIYESKKKISVHIPPANITWLSHQNLLNLSAGDEVNVTLIYRVPPSFFVFNITIFEKKDSHVISTKENYVKCDLSGIYIPQSYIWLLMAHSSVLKKAFKTNTSSSLIMFPFGVIHAEMEEEFVLNITFKLSNDLYCLPGREINLIIESDIGRLPITFKVIRPFFNPDLIVKEFFEITGKNLLTNISITHSPTSAYSAHDIQVIYECNGMGVSVLSKDPFGIFALSEKVSLSDKFLLGEIKKLEVGEKAQILISGYFYESLLSDSCDQKVSLFWKSQQIYSPLIGPQESETVVVKKKVVYRTYEIPNYGFIFLGFFMGILFGVLCSLITVCCFRKYSFTKKYILQKNEVNIADFESGQHQNNANILSTENVFYPSFDTDSPKVLPKNSFLSKLKFWSKKSISVAHEPEFKDEDLWRSALMHKEKEQIFKVPKIVEKEHELLHKFLLRTFQQLWINAIKTSLQKMHDMKDITDEVLLNAIHSVDILLSTLQNHLKVSCLDGKNEHELIAEIILYSYKQGLSIFEDNLRFISIPILDRKITSKPKTIQLENNTLIEGHKNKCKKYREDLNDMFKLLCDKLVFECLLDANGCYISSSFASLSHSMFLAFLEEFISLFTPWVKHIVFKQLDMLIRKRYISQCLSTKFKEVFVEELKHVDSCFKNQRYILVEKFEKKHLLSYLHQRDTLLEDHVKSLDSLWASIVSFSEAEFVENTKNCLKSVVQVIQSMKENDNNFHFSMFELNNLLVEFLQDTMNIFITRLNVLSQNLAQGMLMDEAHIVDYNEKSFQEEDWDTLRFKKDFFQDLIQYLKKEFCELFDEISSTNRVFCSQVEKHIVHLHSASLQKLPSIKSTLPTTVILTKILVKSTIYCSGPVPWGSWESFWSHSALTTLSTIINKFSSIDCIKAINIKENIHSIIEHEKNNHVWLKRNFKEMLGRIIQSVDSMFHSIEMKEYSYDSDNILVNLYKKNTLSGITTNLELSSKESLFDTLKNFVIGILIEAQQSKNEQVASHVNIFMQSIVKVLKNSYTNADSDVKEIMNSLKSDLQSFLSFCSLFHSPVPGQLLSDISFHQDEITEHLYHLGLHHQFKERKVICYEKLIFEHFNFINFLHSNHLVEELDMVLLLRELANVLSENKLNAFYKSNYGPLLDLRWDELYSSTDKQIFNHETEEHNKVAPRKLKKGMNSRTSRQKKEK